MYTLYYPSGRLFKDDVLVNQAVGDPVYEEYLAWVRLDNGPTFLPDPPVPPAVATAGQIAQAMLQLGYTEATLMQLTDDVFPLAVTL